MEATEQHVASVHVLRHSFRPSQHLAVALERYLRPGIAQPRSFLYATRAVVIDFNRHSISDVNLDIDAASGAFLKRTQTKVELGGVNNLRDNQHVVAIKLANEALRVALFPRDPDQFRQLIEPFDHLPNDSSKPPSPNMRHFIYADILPNVLGDMTTVAKATNVLNRELDDTVSARLYTAQPSGIDRQVLR